MRDDAVPGDATFFLNRASIDDLILAKAREESKGPMLARWRFVQMIDAEMESRKASNRRKYDHR